MEGEEKAEAPGAEEIAGDQAHQPNPFLTALLPRRTGATIVVFREGAAMGVASRRMSAMFRTGTNIVGMSELASVPFDTRDMILIEDLHAAIIPIAPSGGQAAINAIRADRDVAEDRPEFYLFAQQEFRDATVATWGVQAVGALASPFTGKDIKVAILDTGIDASHPDFTGRIVDSRSFVSGETVEDLQGHGTHCAGTAIGGTRQPGVPRYGVAPEAGLCVGKVLNNAGSGAERNIIAGMNWAIDIGCEVISMSLGAPVGEGGRASLLYERAARRALDNGCLIVAAAGNESNRDFGSISPVGSPANAPSILAVGAVDPFFKPASFSNGGINPDGGNIDLVAPGTNVFSTVPVPRRYRALNGTSMACPHVAGVAALWAESNPALRGRALWDILTSTARPLDGQLTRDVGAGLVQAPSGDLA